MKEVSRIGNFTSSGIVALMDEGKIPLSDREIIDREKSGSKSRAKYKPGGFGPKALNYIKQKNWERKSGRSMSQEVWAKETAWGHLNESRVMDLCGPSYHRTGDFKSTLVHPEYDFWVGTPDGQKYILADPKIVAEVKCPYTLTSFFTFADCGDIYDVRLKHSHGETYYWQLVSNACILGLDMAELIIYCPYESELPEIQREAALQDDIDTAKWIERVNPRMLPYLIEGREYKNLKIFEFEVPKEDKNRLTERVMQAGKKLWNQGQMSEPEPIKVVPEIEPTDLDTMMHNM